MAARVKRPPRQNAARPPIAIATLRKCAPSAMRANAALASVNGNTSPTTRCSRSRVARKSEQAPRHRASLAADRLAASVLDRAFEGLGVKGRHALHLAEALGRIPDREGEHRPCIRSVDDVDEIVVALRVVDRLDLDTQRVELGFGLVDPLRLLACPFRAACRASGPSSR